LRAPGKVFSPCAESVRGARSGHRGRTIKVRWRGSYAPLFFLEDFHGNVLDESNGEEEVSAGRPVEPQSALLLAGP
jgi:hypothetical protein